MPKMRMIAAIVITTLVGLCVAAAIGFALGGYWFEHPLPLLIATAYFAFDYVAFRLRVRPTRKHGSQLRGVYAVT